MNHVWFFIVNFLTPETGIYFCIASDAKLLSVFVMLCCRVEELRVEWEKSKSGLEVVESGLKSQIDSLTHYYKVTKGSHSCPER